MRETWGERIGFMFSLVIWISWSSVFQAAEGHGTPPFKCVCTLSGFTQLRPPQPAVYLFVLDVSHNAVETGYLNVFCQSLLDNINTYVFCSASCYRCLKNKV